MLLTMADCQSGQGPLSTWSDFFSLLLLWSHPLIPSFLTSPAESRASRFVLEHPEITPVHPCKCTYPIHTGSSPATPHPHTGPLTSLDTSERVVPPLSQFCDLLPLASTTACGYRLLVQTTHTHSLSQVGTHPAMSIYILLGHETKIKKALCGIEWLRLGRTCLYAGQIHYIDQVPYVGHSFVGCWFLRGALRMLFSWNKAPQTPYHKYLYLPHPHKHIHTDR